MSKSKYAVIALVTVFGLGGCASAIESTISGGDESVRSKGSSMPEGVSYTEKLALPAPAKFPVKVSNWAQLSKEQRDVLKDYVYDRGDYVPVTIQPIFGSMGPGIKSGFGSGHIYLEGGSEKSFNLLMTDWREKSVILLELPATGTCSYFSKKKMGDTSMDTGYVTTSMAIADNNALVDLIKKMAANKEKIDAFYKEYLKTKDSY